VADSAEEVSAASLIFSNGFPAFIATIHERMRSERKEICCGECHGEILLPVPEIMLQMIAIVFQNIESFVFNFPPRAAASGDLNDIVSRDRQAGDEVMLVANRPIGRDD